MSDPRPISQRLKDDNWRLHQIAERTPGPATLMHGEVTREVYARLLRETLPVARALDAKVRAAREAEPRLRELIADDQMQAENIAADLAFLGEPAEPLPMDDLPPGTRRLLVRIEERGSDPFWTLGMHYVRTGATNGNHYLAGRLRRVLGLGTEADRQAGTRYLDPFGTQQRFVWGAFKTTLDAIAFTEEEKDLVFEGTRDAFLYAINLTEAEHRAEEELLAAHAAGLDKAEFDAHHAPAH